MVLKRGGIILNKLKELWGNNKVLIVLGIILIACIIIICVVTISFFFGGSKSTYGDRLDSIKDYPVKDSFKDEFVSGLEKDDLISDVSMDVRGKIIYITIEFNQDTSLIDAENRAAKTLENFDKDLLEHYDINFTLKCEKSDNSEGFTILGAKNTSGAGLVWNNNTQVEKEAE